MGNDNYLKNKIGEVGYLYEYDLLKDFIQDEYRDDDYLYNFYSSCVQQIESKKLPCCIYKLLWKWTKQDNKKCCDVMNSFNTYMNKTVYSMIDNDEYDDGSMNEALSTFTEITDAVNPKPSKQLVFYFIRKHKIKKMMKKNSKEIMEKMSELSKWTNTIGNFVLLHQTERGGRGENVYKNGAAKDRMDVYLNNLKNHFNNSSLGKSEPNAFINYINENYLWDYVGEDYNVIPLFQNSDNKYFEKELPNAPECYIALAENIIKNIKHRGMFMEIMIRLSIESPKQFKQVKKTKNANSYADVIKKIDIINLPENLKHLINMFQMGIV